jgi:predicted kinase
MNPENTPGNANAGGKSLRLLRPSVVVLCGPAACGKSTFAERHFRPTQVISSDWARGRVADDDRDQRYNTQAFALVHFLVEQRLTVNRLCVVDSTALTPQARKDLVDMAKKFQVPATLLFFNVPLDTCIERDKNRERSVGKVIVERQYQAFEQSKEAIHQEGFDQIVEIQEGDSEKIQVDVLFRPVSRPAPAPQHSGAVAPRRFERSAQPFRPRPSGHGGDGRTTSTPSVPPGAERPTTRPAAPTVPRVEPGVASAQAPVAASPIAAPAAVHPPAVPPAAVVTPKPVAPASPQAIPVGAEAAPKG